MQENRWEQSAQALIDQWRSWRRTASDVGVARMSPSFFPSGDGLIQITNFPGRLATVLAVQENLHRAARATIGLLRRLPILHFSTDNIRRWSRIFFRSRCFDPSFFQTEEAPALAQRLAVSNTRLSIEP
jgi:hypothetical protein